jgi:hypothetical protein
VRKGGFAPPRSCERQPLKTLRLGRMTYRDRALLERRSTTATMTAAYFRLTWAVEYATGAPAHIREAPCSACARTTAQRIIARIAAVMRLARRRLMSRPDRTRGTPSCCAAYCLRRREATNPAKPSPRRASVPGSGTVVDWADATTLAPVDSNTVPKICPLSHGSLT